VTAKPRQACRYSARHGFLITSLSEIVTSLTFSVMANFWQCAVQILVCTIWFKKSVVSKWDRAAWGGGGEELSGPSHVSNHWTLLLKSLGEWQRAKQSRELTLTDFSKRFGLSRQYNSANSLRNMLCREHCILMILPMTPGQQQWHLRNPQWAAEKSANPCATQMDIKPQSPEYSECKNIWDLE